MLREQQGDDAGQQHARRHVVVNRKHVGPQARIAGGARNADRSGGIHAGRRARVLLVGHFISFARAKGPFATADISWMPERLSSETGHGPLSFTAESKRCTDFLSPSVRQSRSVTC